MGSWLLWALGAGLFEYVDCAWGGRPRAWAWALLAFVLGPLWWVITVFELLDQRRK